MKKVKNIVARAGDQRVYSCHGDEGDAEVLRVEIIKTRKDKSKGPDYPGRIYTFKVLETLVCRDYPPREVGEIFERWREDNYDWEYHRALRKIYPGHNYNYWDLFE